MGIEIKVPSLGESISEATITSILVPNGSQVSQDQEIIEIETEKVNQVLYAPQAGILSLNIKEGDTVKIGQVIGSVEPSQGGDNKNQDSSQVAVAAPTENSAPQKEEMPKPLDEQPQESHKADQEPAIFAEIRKSPESFVEELRAPEVISKKSQAIENPLRASETTKIESPREERKKMSKIRQTIAKRLVEAKQTMALLTTFNEVDMTSVIELRKNHKEAFEKKHGVRLGFMSFFIKAVSSALRQFPEVNAYVDGDDIVFRKYYDINVAISSAKGLVVPVIENCDQLSFAAIEKKIIELAKKASENKLSMDEMRSGGFTITNGGIFGSTFSTPIVNPPQSAILGMHRISERPYVVDGKIVIRPIMILALSYDHRIIDGQEAVSFLARVVKIIEDPAALLIDL